MKLIGKVATANSGSVPPIKPVAGIEKEIPLIAAGGIRSFEDIARLQSLGAAAVQALLQQGFEPLAFEHIAMHPVE